jgi:hypothetical protein
MGGALIAIRSDNLELEADNSCLPHWDSCPMTSEPSLIALGIGAWVGSGGGVARLACMTLGQLNPQEVQSPCS